MTKRNEANCGMEFMRQWCADEITANQLKKSAKDCGYLPASWYDRCKQILGWPYNFQIQWGAGIPWIPREGSWQEHLQHRRRMSKFWKGCSIVSVDLVEEVRMRLRQGKGNRRDVAECFGMKINNHTVGILNVNDLKRMWQRFIAQG